MVTEAGKKGVGEKLRALRDPLPSPTVEVTLAQRLCPNAYTATLRNSVFAWRHTICDITTW